MRIFLVYYWLFSDLNKFSLTQKSSLDGSPLGCILKFSLGCVQVTVGSVNIDKKSHTIIVRLLVVLSWYH